MEFEFSFKLKMISYRPFQWFCRFMGAMSGADKASPDGGAWFVEADHVSVTALARRRSRARLYDRRLKSGRVIIVSAMFFALIAAALLVGGHAAIDPLVQSAMAARQTKGTGDVVYAMPDGIFCRHMSFDNVTAEVTEGPIERCADDIARNRSRGNRGFAWRTKN
jgi:hypothetical protein